MTTYKYVKYCDFDRIIREDDSHDHFLAYCIEDKNNNTRWVTPYQLYILNY